jgi:hypothetical protein
VVGRRRRVHEALLNGHWRGMARYGYRRSSTTNDVGFGVASIIWLIAVIAAIVLVIYIFMVLFEANPRNDLVDFFSDLAGNLAWIFKDLFEIDNNKLEVLVNYGLAALVYLAVGRAIARALD